MNKQVQKFNEYCMRLGKILEGQNQISYVVGWVECKDEILKILHEKGNSHFASCGERYYHENVIEEIKNL